MLLRSPDVTVTSADDGALLVSGLPAERIGAIAAAAGIAVAELSTEQTSLEDAFVDLTKDAVEYRAGTSTSRRRNEPRRGRRPRPIQRCG